MNILLRKLLIFGVVIPLLIVAGCSTVEEKQPEDQGPAVEQDAPAAEVAKEQSADKESGAEAAAQPEKKPEVQEEPVVEVIPGKVEEAELTVQPIPETPAEPAKQQSEISEKPADTVQEKPAPVEDKPSEPAIAEDKAKPAAPVSTGPDHFVITAAKKDASHPQFGKGHQMGFVVNNVQGQEIVLERGKTYKFDVATDPMHDVYISLKEIGWGSTPYSEGIEGMYTYKGTMTIKPTDKTPDTLYYSCRNHPYMGGKIHVVNPGETVKIAKASAAASAAGAAEKKTQISAGDVNQKIMFAEMLIKSKTSQSVLNSNISEAVEMHNKAQADLQSARDNLKAGDNTAAYNNAESAIALLKKSSKLVPNESELARMKEHHKELQASIADFEASHKDSYERVKKKQGEDAAVDYDKQEVKKLKDSAADLAKKGDYRKANQNLEKAQHMITSALHKMLDKQTIVYDLNFETAEEEYEYELKRFQGYDELIPIAVEQKKPAEGAKKLMESFVKKGRDLRDRAVQKAKEGDFPTAIAMLQDATKDVRRGLRMIGVMQ